MLGGLDRAASAGIIKAKRRRRGEQTMAQGHDSANDHQPHHDDHHRHGHGHSHTHGMIDPTILSTQRGIWAIKWSFVGLLATALFQVVVVLFSGSVALLADTIHNFGDAATAVPLWIAFLFARFKPTRRFSFCSARLSPDTRPWIASCIPGPWSTCGRWSRRPSSASWGTRASPSFGSAWGRRSAAPRSWPTATMRAWTAGRV